MGLGKMLIDLDLAVILCSISLVPIFMIFILPALIERMWKRDARENFQRHFGFDPLSPTAKREEFVTSVYVKLRNQWFWEKVPIPQPKMEHGWGTFDSLRCLEEHHRAKIKIMSNLSPEQKASEQRWENLREAERAAKYFGFKLE